MTCRFEEPSRADSFAITESRAILAMASAIRVLLLK